MHKPLIISSLTFNAPLKYSEGDTITANEAAALNALFHKDLTERLRRTIVTEQKAAPGGLSEETLAKLQKAFDTAVAEHDFSPKSPTNTFDPVQAEAIKIAMPDIIGLFRKRGIDHSTKTKDELEEYALKAIQKFPDKYLAEAKRRIAAMRQVAEEVV